MICGVGSARVRRPEDVAVGGGEGSRAPGTSTWGWKRGGRPRAMRSLAAVGV